MAVHNAVDILGWALEPQGSAWIARQAYQYLEEEFYSFSASIELLAKVDKDTLVKVMKSDFTQASESEILQTLIRWGEQQLKMKTGHRPQQETPPPNQPQVWPQTQLFSVSFFL